jgi:hypothetical protein
MRLPVLLVPLVAISVAAGCDDDGDDRAPAAGCLDGTSGEVTIVAEDIAWDRDCIEAVAEEPLTITVDNRDDGVNHNLHLTDAPGEPSTELEAGPVTQTLEVPPLPVGDYEYVCDIHPNMVGTLQVAEANPG